MKRLSLLILVIVILVIGIWGTINKNQYGKILFYRNYYTSKYSEYCYAKGTKQPRIKHKIFFENLSACGKPLK